MSVTPAVLTSTSGNWHSSFEYRWQSTSGIYELYGLYEVSNNTYYPNQEIKVDTVTNTWSDYGSGNPYNVTETANNTITLSSSAGSTFLVLQKPSTASWISSGGGTSTEEVSILSGSLSKSVNNLGQRFVVYTIDASSPTSSSANGLYDVRYTLKDGTTGRVYQPNSINHSYNTSTSGNFGLFYSGTTPDGLYELIHIGSSLNSFAITVLAELTLSRGKVHSNFW